MLLFVAMNLILMITGCWSSTLSSLISAYDRLKYNTVLLYYLLLSLFLLYLLTIFKFLMFLVDKYINKFWY